MRSRLVITQMFKISQGEIIPMGVFPKTANAKDPSHTEKGPGKNHI